MTSRPSSVSSLARIDPVHPRPMMTTSRAGSLCTILRLALDPFRAAFKADRRQRETLIVFVDPFPVVVTRAGKSDHAPADHVLVAAVDGIGEEALLHVLHDLLEKGFAIDAAERDRALLEAVEKRVLV